MEELIKRLEEATVGDRWYDYDIQYALTRKGAPAAKIAKITQTIGGEIITLKDGGAMAGRIEAPRYTTSLDAALTLVPEGWMPDISRMHPDFLTDLNKPWVADIAGPISWVKEEEYGNLEPVYETCGATAVTAPLALCIAALRARERG